MLKLISFIINVSIVLIHITRSQSKLIQMTDHDVEKIQHDFQFINKMLNELNKKYEIVFEVLNNENGFIWNDINNSTQICI
jgi:hypothetical protein